MTLKEIASVSGKPGLYKVVKPTRTGIILETIDAQKKKIIANANSRVSLLQEISVYTTSEQGSILLEDVFKIIKSKKEGKLDVVTSDKELFAFLEGIVPEFDTEKVYPSDIKKMIVWYNALSEFCPEIFVALVADKKEDATTKAEKPAKVSKETATKAPKAAAAKKIDAGKKGGGATAVKSAKRGA